MNKRFNEKSIIFCNMLPSYYCELLHDERQIGCREIMLFSVTYYEKYYGIIIDIYGLTLEQVTTTACTIA